MVVRNGKDAMVERVVGSDGLRLARLWSLVHVLCRCVWRESGFKNVPFSSTSTSHTGSS
jgi:hypothetical protein